MLENYVQWLFDVYIKQVGAPPPEASVVKQAIAILRWHSSRWPKEEDFVSIVVAEVADRLKTFSAGSLPQSPFDPFLKTLDQAADAVRHRIIREARKRTQHPPSEVFDHIAASASKRETLMQVIADELSASLSNEEQAVLTLVLDGVPVDQVAKDLHVSIRTVYRRLQEIRQRISQAGEP